MADLSGNPSSNPFDNAFEMLGRSPRVTTESVNAEELAELIDALTRRAVDFGRVILLRSPRAGFGKTHLLMRCYQQVAYTHEFIPLEPSKGRYLDDELVLDAVLRKYTRMLPAGGGLTFMDLLARRILAVGLETLVRSGEVPSQDRDGALKALQQRPLETLDFHNAEAVTAQWAAANFALLGPRLTTALAAMLNTGYRPVSWWVELLFRYSSAPLEQNSRNSSLFETVFGGDVSETEMHERLVTLLNLTGLVTSPVLVLDEVEGLSSSPEAGLQLATFLNAIHQSCKKLALIISVNGDVWQTAFLPRLPCGLKDRLNDIVVELKPLSEENAMAILRDRAGDRADEIAAALDFNKGVIYPRGLIREAAVAWRELIAAESTESSEPFAVEAPVAESDAHAEAEAVQDYPESVISEPGSEPVPEEQSPFKPDVVREGEQGKSYSAIGSPPLAGESEEMQPQEIDTQEAEALAGSIMKTLLGGIQADQASIEPHGVEQAPQPQAPQRAPEHVIDSPFSVVAEEKATPAASQPPQVEGSAGDPIPKVVTQEDHDKVDQLLRQFRDRYGRE